MNKGNEYGLLSRYRAAVMGFAALWILLFHEWQLLFSLHKYIGFIEEAVKKTGYSGVDIFFFLSGLGLTYSIGKSSVPQFYLRRIKRIILPFLAVGILQALTDGWSVKQFLMNVSGISFYKISIYTFLWFVPAIMTLYLLFPLYYKLFSKAKNKTFFTLAVIELWLILTLLLREKVHYDLFGFTNRIPVFLLGVLFGYEGRTRELDFSPAVRWAAVLALISGALLSYLANYKGMYILVPGSNCFLPTLLLAVSICLILPRALETLTKHAAPVGKAVTKALSFAGSISLEIYVVQEWLGGIITEKLTGKTSWPVLDVMIVVSVIAAAWLLSKLCRLILSAFDRLTTKSAI